MINIDPRSSMPIYEQIISGIKEAVVKGTFAKGDKLPSIREMASILSTNPNTVSKAYGELERQGVIETLRGRGTFLCENYKPRLEEERMDSLKNALKSVVLEAKYLNLSDEKLCDIVKDIYKSLNGGDSSDRS